MYIAENLEQPYRELFIWAVLYCRMRLAMIFWKECPDQLGSALVAGRIFKSMACQAKSDKKPQLVDELVSNAR